MTDPATTLVVCKYLRDRIRVWEAEAKQQLSLLAGERKAAVVNGQTIGYVTETQGRRETVVDDATLLEWVRVHNPTEIEETVRPAFRRKLVDEVLKIGALLDSDGVVSDAITIVQREPYAMCRTTEMADQVIGGLLAHGRLSVDGVRDEMPRLEAGESV